MIWSPSTIAPVWSTARQRSASPSTAKPGVRAVLDDGALERLEVGGAAAVVDVEAVRLGADRDHLGARVGEGLGPDLAGRAVRAVEDDLEAGERLVEGGDQVRGVLLDGRAVRRHPAHLGAGRPVPLLVEVLLDLALERVVELDPAAGEELDAVVGHRVVGRGDHHAHVGAEGVGEVGDARRRQHPQPQHVDAGGRQAGHHRVLEELPGDPGVAADDRERPLAAAAEPAVLDEHPGRSNAEAQGQLSGQMTVRQAPDPVGAEDPHLRNWISACCTAAPYGPS